MGNPTRQEILLESGTNEMEILEFYLGTQSFGINVHKLREIIPYDPAKKTALPESPPSLLGTLLVRGETVPIIDLNTHLGRKQPDVSESQNRPIVLICEFNKVINGFLVDGVNQIHRISWQNVSSLPDFLEVHRPRFTGSIDVEGREVLMVDLEHIVAEIDPSMEMIYDHSMVPANGTPQTRSEAEQREQKKIMIAEDSAIIRAGILKVLQGSGYTRITSFVDGLECYESIKKAKSLADSNGEPITDHVNLLITDIEMPRMDGLTLCRKVKEELGLSQLAVVMFSSLLDDQMVHKCQTVGADGYITKPQVPELVSLLDGFLLNH